MRLCVIPARGGSKRIPRKNIKKFHGKPIINFSIEAALNSKIFDKIIVSTDDDEISTIAKSAGAEVPFLRPKSLADDFTATIPVMTHAILELESHGFKYSSVCCIYPTAPFVRPIDILKAAEILESDDLDYVFTSTVYKHPIERSFTLNNQKLVEPFIPGKESIRSQDLIEKYHDAGQYYWGTREAWLQGRKIFSKRSKTIILPSYLVQDIDTIEDWQRAELMWRALKLK